MKPTPASPTLRRPAAQLAAIALLCRLLEAGRSVPEPPRLVALDRRVVAWARGLPHPRPADVALIALSRATDHSAGWFAVGLLGAAADSGRRGRWLQATARIAAAESGVRMIKRAVPRRRPDLGGLPPLAPTTSPRSFPSSHTAAAVAAVAAFDGLLPRGLLRAVAGATAFSRLYLGLHYPSDVIAGGVLGRLLGVRGSGA